MFLNMIYMLLLKAFHLDNDIIHHIRQASLQFRILRRHLDNVTHLINNRSKLLPTMIIMSSHTWTSVVTTQHSIIITASIYTNLHRSRTSVATTVVVLNMHTRSHLLYFLIITINCTLIITIPSNFIDDNTYYLSI
jgi:hypothetical protein